MASQNRAPIVASTEDLLHVGIGLGVLGYQRMRIVQRQIDQGVDAAFEAARSHAPAPAQPWVRLSHSLVQRLRP